ncbi:SusC/RagA family TonB-linked outer membrane protein [Pedobacter sp. SL55]|uniref:SusC/RagA family TonB-linked outer membrane protein n=1 Tax=Pedobacter sp. SL55 TaxID=2995161 RepID=UPI00226D5663|nr:TonB-dependent receptor [Pedobacter sp. SL55]WAC41886.1 TonB-dependent receptor [Pedobacter sp. SL55]
MKKLLQSLFILLFVASNAMAQNRTITGTVTSKDDGLPLPGVSVKVKGTNVGTSTASNGKFTLTVPVSATNLEFSSLGFLSKTIAISGSNFDIAMEADQQQLSEIVVSGYGTLAKRALGGAVSKVSGSQFENQAIKSLDQALQGRTPGVVVQSNNGIPGGAINVQIRGVASFTAGTQPLYIIDGVQMNMESSTSITQANPLAGINTNDIESIEVLRDAATASIYGAQAANGVVLVTTKRGAAGKTKFTANVYSGVVNAIKFFDVTNSQEFLQLRTEAVRNGNSTLSDAAVRNSVLGGVSLNTALTDQEIANLPSTDWQREASRTGIVQNYELSASGGNEKTKFYMSSSYNKSNTFISKVDFKRGVLRTNLEHKASDKLTFDARINLSSFSQQAPFATDGSSFGNPAYSASQVLPINPVYNADGTYFGLPGSGQIFAGNLNQNIVAINDFNSAQTTTNQVVGSIAAIYKFGKNISFKSFYSLDYRAVKDYQYRDPRTNDAYNRQGLGYNAFEDRVNFLTNQTLSFVIPNLGDHSLSGFVGAEFRSDVNEGFSAQADGYPSPEFRNLNSAANPVSVGGFFTGFRRAGLFSALRYDYKRKYSLSANLRYDGSSKFGENNQYGFFGGVSGSWDMAQEEFLKNTSWLNELRLRASYGVVGNDDIGNFSSRGLYGGGGVYGGAPAITPTALSNIDLRWEKKSTIDLGVDFSMFKKRIGGSIGVYRLLSTDLLLSQPLLNTTGFSSITKNAGSIQINGFEAEINTVNIRTKDDFTWTTNFNFSYFKSEIKKLYDGLQVLPSDIAIRVGAQRGDVWSQKYAGVNPATGRPMWYDINDNITYNPTAADRRLIGNTVPNLTGGLTNEFRYKGFDFSFLLQYQYGRTQLDGQLQFYYRMGTANHNTDKNLFDRRWTTPGQITDVPRPINGGAESQGASHTTTSTRFYYKTDMIRVKNIQLGYTVPKNILSKLKIDSFRIYAQGQNLFTYDDYPGYDPEYFGTSTGIIPQSKNLTFGLIAGF